MLEDTKGVIHKFINRRGGKYNGSKDEKTNNGRQNYPTHKIQIVQNDFHQKNK
jgi:hypothetical protein